jgi:hypothetical protein
LCFAAVLALPVPALGQGYGWIHLSSGDSLPLLGIGRFAIPHDSALLALDYETRVPLGDTATLRREVLDIWPSLRKLADDQHFWAAAIRAHHTESATADSAHRSTRTTFRTFGFVFQRTAEGHWHFYHDTTAIP